MDGRYNPLSRVVVFLLILCVLFHCSVLASSGKRGTGEFYIDEYGVLDGTEKPTVEHAQSLFERLLRAAGSIPHVTPRLIVLPEVAAKWENWAVSL
ncbi:MAG: hypothetical protein GY866_23910, partial [Proteobacteria bacterium]|nr:hypothetical protein [Pseudomonadota bacterium]